MPFIIITLSAMMLQGIHRFFSEQELIFKIVFPSNNSFLAEPGAIVIFLLLQALESKLASCRNFVNNQPRNNKTISSTSPNGSPR